VSQITQVKFCFIVCTTTYTQILCFHSIVETHKKRHTGWAWWYMPVIPVFRRLKQGDLKFQASLDS
jgi:hypothetical protein